MKNVTKDLANRVLAVMIISLLWMAVLAVSVILAWLFNGEQFLIRYIIILPFTIGATFITMWIWSHYNEKPKCSCGSRNVKKMYAYNGPDFTCGYDIEYTCKDCNNSWNN